MRFVILAALLILNIGTLPTPSHKIAAPANQAVVIVILDISGSMEKNDPDGLRFTGTRLLSSLLDPGDSAGIIFFSTQSSVVTDGLMHIQNEHDKAALLQHIQDRPADGYTDVKSAFLSAQELLRNANLSGQAVYIVFLTDGKPEIENMYPGYEEETLELAKSLGVPVLSIALTSSAQTPFLDRLASETGGRVILANNAADLLDAYLNILGQIKDRTILPISSNDLSFFLGPGLAPYINSISFVLSRPANLPVRLVSPAGRLMQPDDQDVRFYVEDPDFLTISLGGPPPGNWTFEAPENQELKAYAILHSRLRIEIVSPGIYHQQSKPTLIEVRMIEELPDGSRVPIIGDATFSAVVTLPDGMQESLDRFYDDGTHGDAVAGDGNFSRLYVHTDQVGTYQLDIRGWKSSVPVEFTTAVYVIDFPAMILDQPMGFYKTNGKPVEIKVHFDSTEPFPLERGELVAVVTNPSGEEQDISLVGTEDGYAGSYLPLKEGVYRIAVQPRDARYRGLPYTETVSSQFEVKFLRTMQIESGEWKPAGCFSAQGSVQVRIRVFSPHAESIQLSVSDVDGLQAYPASITTKGGAEEFLVEVRTPSGMLSSGTYQFHLEVKNSSGFEQQPRPADFSFEVPNVYQRCGSVFRWGGLSGFVLVIAVFLITRKIRLDAMPAIVSGTLRYWQEGGSGSFPTQEHDLNLFSKSTILVGSASDCDIRISDDGLRDQHFTLTAEKTDDGTQIILKPLSEIWKGYSQFHKRSTIVPHDLGGSPVVLHHGDIFRIGKLNFQYLSDSGE